jgi:hypothetical protein
MKNRKKEKIQNTEERNLNQKTENNREVKL